MERRNEVGHRLGRTGAACRKSLASCLNRWSNLCVIVDRAGAGYLGVRMRRVGELEAVIMERLWEWGRPALVREVVDDLHGDRPLAYTTVMTVMENLHRKGWLRRERDGRAGGYEPHRPRSADTPGLVGRER